MLDLARQRIDTQYYHRDTSLSDSVGGYIPAVASAIGAAFREPNCNFTSHEPQTRSVSVKSVKALETLFQGFSKNQRTLEMSC